MIFYDISRIVLRISLEIPWTKQAISWTVPRNSWKCPGSFRESIRHVLECSGFFPGISWKCFGNVWNAHWIFIELFPNFPGHFRGSPPRPLYTPMSIVVALLVVRKCFGHNQVATVMDVDDNCCGWWLQGSRSFLNPRGTKKHQDIESSREELFLQYFTVFFYSFL